MGAVESGELHDGQPVSFVPRLPTVSPPELGPDGEQEPYRRRNAR